MVNKTGILKYINYFVLIITIGAVIISVITSQSQMAYGIETLGKEYGIKISPDGQLFNISGLAPGVSYSTVLTVTNKGQKKFAYDIKVDSENHVNPLYEALDLKIKKGENTLYSGKLKNLKVVLGSLETKKSDQLDFTLGLPIDCGSEYESQRTTFNFIISASAFENSSYLDHNE